MGLTIFALALAGLVVMVAGQAKVPTQDIVDELRTDIMDLHQQGRVRFPTLVRIAFRDCSSAACDGCIKDTPLNAGLTLPLTQLNSLFDSKYNAHMSRADLYVNAAVIAAVEASMPAGGDGTGARLRSSMLWGRPDVASCDAVPDGVPAPSLAGSDEVLEYYADVFGLTNREAVVLSGAHSLGQARNGFQGIWTPNAENVLDNQYFKNLVNAELAWEQTETPAGGRQQWTHPATGEGFMLNSDMALFKDIAVAAQTNGVQGEAGVSRCTYQSCPLSPTAAIVQEYAADNALFLRDFAPAFERMVTKGADRATLTAVNPAAWQAAQAALVPDQATVLQITKELEALNQGTSTWSLQIRFPTLLRLAFFDCTSAKCDACIDQANTSASGLRPAITALDALHAKLEGKVSKADLWANAAVYATIYTSAAAPDPVRMDMYWGRADAQACSGFSQERPEGTPGSATAGSQATINYYATVFGYSAREAVVISGAHSIGRAAASDFQGVWDPNGDTVLDNNYFKHLRNTEAGWAQTQVRSGKYQWQPAGEGMMLNSDMGLWKDFEPENATTGLVTACTYETCPQASTAAFVEQYADDNALFAKDFGAAFTKMLLKGYDAAELAIVNPSGGSKKAGLAPRWIGVIVAASVTVLLLAAAVTWRVAILRRLSGKPPPVPPPLYFDADGKPGDAYYVDPSGRPYGDADAVPYDAPYGAAVAAGGPYAAPGAGGPQIYEPRGGYYTGASNLVTMTFSGQTINLEATQAPRGRSWAHARACAQAGAFGGAPNQPEAGDRSLVASESTATTVAPADDAYAGAALSLPPALVEEVQAWAVTRPEKVLEQQMVWILEQCDGQFLSTYKLMEGEPLRVGGQGAVAFANAMYAHNTSYAIKFYISTAAFETERQICTNEKLRAAMPAVHAVVEDADSRATAGMPYPLNTMPLPPMIITEKGEPLDDFIRRQAPDFFTSLQVMVHIAEKLQAMHEAGYAHRDLKPSNCIWLPSRNTWSLIDFGCTAPFGQDVSIAYTFTYAAPELVTSVKNGITRHSADPAADMFAFGIMCYELLTNERFYAFRDKDDIEAMLTGAAPLPSERTIEPELRRKLGPAGMREALLCMLSRDPTQRPQASKLLKRWRSTFQESTMMTMDSVGPDGTRETTSTSAGAPVGGDIWASVQPSDLTNASQR